MYECEGWTIKKAECWRTEAFELWCWRSLLRVPWTTRRSNQSILKDINPEYSLEGLMLKLECQYFGYLMWGANSFEKTLMLGRIEGRRRRGQLRMKWLGGIIDSVDMSLSKARNSKGQGSLVCCSPWDFKESDMTEWLNNYSNINSWAFILVYYSHCLDVSKTSHFVYISVWGMWVYIVHVEILPCPLVYRFAYWP